MKLSKKLAEKLLLRKIDKLKMKVFMLCFLSSLIFWVFAKLSKEYSSMITLNLRYQNIPFDLISYDEDEIFLEKKIKLKVKATGFKLLGYKLSEKYINVDLQNIIKKEYSGAEKIIWKIKKEDLETHSNLKNVVILDIQYPFSIEFDKAGIIQKKRVPIILDGIIRPDNGYTLKETIFFHPDSLEVEGLEKHIENIKFIKTSKFSLVNLKEDIQKNIDLERVNKIKISESNVHLEIFIENLIEKSINVKIKSNDSNIKIVPEYVNILFNVGESKYEDMDSSFFEAYIDFEEKNQDNVLPIKLESKKMGIDIIKITPAVVRFIKKK